MADVRCRSKNPGDSVKTLLPKGRFGERMLAFFARPFLCGGLLDRPSPDDTGRLGTKVDPHPLMFIFRSFGTIFGLLSQVFWLHLLLEHSSRWSHSRCFFCFIFV